MLRMWRGARRRRCVRAASPQRLSVPPLPLAPFLVSTLTPCALVLAGLDRQGSSTGSSSRAAPTSPPPRDSPQLAADAALALSLAEQEVGLQYDPAFECDRALALSLAQDDSRLDASSCPVCGAGWDERGLALPTAGDDAAAHQRVFNKRENHVRACLEAKTRFEDGDGGGVGGLGMHGVPDVEADEVDGQTGAGSASAVATGKRPWTGDVGGKDEVRGTAGALSFLALITTDAQTDIPLLEQA